MNDMHTQCPQCLLANSIDCQEPDCPCLSGVPPKKEGGAACMDGASMKLLTTMGLRILALEDLIVRAAGLMPGAEEDSAFLDVLREARRILGKKKGGIFDSVWRTLAAAGWCDFYGGMEYARVSEEWREYTGSESMESFIKRRANIGPDEKKGAAV